MRIPIDKFESYLENKNLKEKTIREYIYYFNKFLKYNALNNETVSRFMADKSNRNVVARSFILNFKKFILQSHDELKLSIDLLHDVQDIELPVISGRAKVRLIKPLKIEQIYLLEKHLKEEKDKVMLLLCFHGGLRFGELIKIKVINFNWGEWKKDMTKMGECRVYGKGDKEGIALLPPDVMKRAARFIKASRNIKSLDSYLFVSDGSTGSMLFKGRSFRNKLKLAGVESGITLKNDKGGLIAETIVHPHRLRHSYGTYLHEVKKLDIREIQEILRHSSISSTQIYTHIDKEKLKEKINLV